uniref:Keratin n=1 Tax=Anolis carolinensis TaxID=28377 RepID=H9GCT6_ANOCA
MSCCPPPCCPPSCTIPSCSSMPMYGLGGTGGTSGGGRSVSTRELGTVAGVTPQSVSQLPSSEVVIQPAPFIMVVPGPILSSSCEPIYVGGATSPGGGGFGGRLGSSSMGSCGVRCLPC